MFVKLPLNDATNVGHQRSSYRLCDAIVHHHLSMYALARLRATACGDYLRKIEQDKTCQYSLNLNHCFYFSYMYDFAGLESFADWRSAYSVAATEFLTNMYVEWWLALQSIFFYKFCKRE